MIKKLLVFPTLSLLLILVAATVYWQSGGDEKKRPDIKVENVRIRAPMPGQSVAVGWFDIDNDGAVDELLSASSPISDNIELHSHTMDDGVMKMRMLKTVRIEGSAKTHFEPGGLHLMIFDAKIPDEAHTVPLTLEFARTGTVNFSAQIMGRSPENVAQGRP